MWEFKERKEGGGYLKMGGKDCFAKYCFERYLLWHIPEEQKSSQFFEPSKCTIALKMLYSISLSTSCVFSKQSHSQMHYPFCMLQLEKILNTEQLLCQHFLCWKINVCIFKTISSVHVKFGLTLLELAEYYPKKVFLNCFDLIREWNLLVPDNLGYLSNVTLWFLKEREVIGNTILVLNWKNRPSSIVSSNVYIWFFYNTLENSV